MIRINIWNDISNGTSYQVHEAILRLRDEKEPVLIAINSFGGSMQDAVAIVNLLESVPNPVITVALGACCSAACMIFACGQYRFIGKDITYMIHQPYTANGPDELNFHEAEEQSKRMKSCLDIYKNSIARKTELPQSLIDDLVKDGKELYFTQKECLEYKIATHKFKSYKNVYSTSKIPKEELMNQLIVEEDTGNGIVEEARKTTKRI